MLLDLRFALRALRKSPGFTLVAVLTLALGIGANTAIFSALDAALFRPLAYPEAERLATVHLSSPGNKNPGMDLVRWSWPKFQTLESLTGTPFEGVAAFAGGMATLTGLEVPEKVPMEMVSPSYFALLGVPPLLGRTFASAGAPPGENEAVVSEGFFRRRLAGAPLSGLTIGVDGKSFKVVGVLPGGFEGLSGRRADVFVRVTDAIEPSLAANRWIHFLNVVARLKPGLRMDGAQAGTMLAGHAVAAAHPSPVAGEEWSAALVPLESSRIEPALRRSLLVLVGAAGFLLLIGCMNLASLLFARAESRRRELAIRVALGASRGRLIRHSLAEAILLALGGGLAGLLLARWSFEAISRLAPQSGSAFPGMTYLVDLSRYRVDLRGALFALLLSSATAVALGFLPGVRAWRTGVLEALTNGAAAGSGRRRFGMGGSLVVVAQLAIALVLLTGAGLLVKSLWRLLHVELGFRPDALVTLRVDTPPSVRSDSSLFRERLVSRLSAVAGVSSVSAGTCAPLAGKCSDGLAWSPEDAVTHVEAPRVDVDYADAGRFSTLGIPIREGRGFDAGDRATGAKVVIVNETLARLFWPGSSALGKRLEISSQPFRRGEPALVVGVVGDVRYGRPEESPSPHAYLPDAQGGSGIPVSHIAVRSALRQGELVKAVRSAVRDLDPNLAIYDDRAMPERVADASSRPRFAAALLASFAGLAVVVSSIGVLGVMTYAVSQRTREIGIRVALGARPAEVFRLFAKRGLALTGAGLLAGVAGALVLTRVLGSLLFGVSPLDPIVFAAATLLLGTLAVLGSILPARLALRVNPVSILRSE